MKKKKDLRKRSALIMSELLDKYKPNPGLPPDHARNILARIYPRMNELAIGSERRLSLMTNGQPETVRTIRRQVELGKQTGITAPTLHALAVVLKLNPLWLQLGTGQREAVQEEPTMPLVRTKAFDGERHRLRQPAEGSLPVRGTVVAGGWFDESANPHVVSLAPPQADLAFAPEAQFAVLVGDGSINRYAQPGDFLIALDAKETRIDPAGHLVVISRVMKNTGLREITARRAVESNGKIELRLESSDSRFKDQSALMLGDNGVSIVGVVLAVYRRVF